MNKYFRKWKLKKTNGIFHIVKTVKRGRKRRIGNTPIKGLNWWTTKDIVKVYHR